MLRSSRFTLLDGLIVEEVAYFDSFPIPKPNRTQGDMASAALATTSS